MENWTLVYRAHRTQLSSRRRVTECYGNATTAYNKLLVVLRQEPTSFGIPERVSHAYLLRPDGGKIPLVSGAPPHPVITREQFLAAVAHHYPLPAKQGPLSVDRDIFRRRLQRMFAQLRPISPDAATVIGHIEIAFLVGSEHGLATLCQQVLGPLGAAPRDCPAARKSLLRRLSALARHAQTAFPEIALMLTYVAHAFAEGTERRVVTACDTFRELRLAELQKTGAAAVSSHK